MGFIVDGGACPLFFTAVPSVTARVAGGDVASSGCVIDGLLFCPSDAAVDVDADILEDE